MIVTLLLGTAVRLYHLDAQSVWFDEAARLIIARSNIATILKTTGGDTLPPLYHLILHFWQLAGTQDFWTRLPSVFANILLIAVMFQLGQMLFNRRVGLIAAAITAILPYLIFHAQQANLYSQYTLLAALQMLIFWRVQKGNTTKIIWAAYVIINLAALYTHYFAAFLLLAAHFFLLIQRPKYKQLLLADALIVIGYLPYVNIFLGKAADVSTGFWLNAPAPLQPFLTLFLLIGSYSLSHTSFIVGLVLILALLGFSLLEIRHHLKRNTAKKPMIFFLLILTFLPIVVVWVISQWLPIYLDRALLIVLPSYILLLAYALANTTKRSPLPIIAGLIACLLVLSIYNYFDSPYYWKPNYRAAAMSLATAQSADKAIIHTSNGSYIPFLVYLPPQNHFLLAGDPAPHHPPQVYENVHGSLIEWNQLSQFQTISLVVALDHSIEYQKAAVEEFDTHFQQLSSEEIDGIIIQTYEVKQ
ncbi:MAG: glycosyltransferase family 39 protein [Chloroflexota bacterium]